MRIIEVRDGFIKIETEEKLELSSFLQINDAEKNYIAQVLQTKSAGVHNIIYAKILFLYDGAFQIYDKTLPSKDAKVIPFGFSLFSKSLECKNPIVAGSFIKDEINIPLEKTYFDKQLLVSVDTAEINCRIVSNLAKQFEKSLIIDTLGVVNSQKFVAGVDFKLPLNTDSLEFIFEDCLNDATSDSKSLIKEIFQDLADYSRTVPFLAFGALKTIVDDMVDKSHIFKLLVLKNKLAKFDKMGYFASTAEEAENLNKILTSNHAVLDLSKLDSTFLNRYLSIILSTIEHQDIRPQIFVEASNALDKKYLKKIITGSNAATFITHSRFKYIKEIKTLFNNFIIEPSFTNNEIFREYSLLLKSMPKNTYLLIGESTGNIPLVSILKEFVQLHHEETSQKEDNLTDIEEIQQQEIQLSDSEEPTLDEISDSDNVTDLQEDFISVTAEPAVVTEDTTEEDECNLPDENLSMEAIEKKSEDLIERVAEEVQTEGISDSMKIFGEDEFTEECSDEEFVEQEEVVEENDDIENEFFEPEEMLEEVVDIEDDLIEEEELSPISDSELEEPEDSDELAESVVSASEIENNDEELQPELLESDLEETPLTEFLEEAEEETNSDVEFRTEINEIQTIELPEDISDLAENAETFDVQESIPDLPTKDVNENLIESTTPDVLSISTENDELDEIVELDESENLDDAIIVDIENEESLDEAALDKAIVEDVDKVFTTMKEDSISDSDLDFIDELNSNVEEEAITLPDGMEELEELAESDESEDGFLEPLEEINDSIQNESDEKEILETRNTSTPIVPVYGADIPAEDIVISDTIEQGDSVVHAKYGNGVVEKMIKYGTKTLYSINFDNVGRRLLDPTLTEIKKR